MEDYYEIAEYLLEDESRLSEIRKRNDVDLDTLYQILQVMHKEYSEDLGELINEEERKRDKQIIELMNEIGAELGKKQEEYDEMAQYEAEKKAEEEKRKREAEYEQDEYYKGYEEEKNVEWIPQEERYEKINEEIEKLEFDIDMLYLELNDSYTEEIRGEIYSKIDSLETRLMQLENERDVIEHDIKMAELGTSLPTMENENIVKRYEELLSERIEMLKAEDNGEKRDKKAWKLNRDLIELVECFAESSPELQERLMEEKKIGSIEYYGDDKEDDVEFEDDDPEYIDALLEKEIKSKEARDAGFEINEFGEIIRPAKQPTTEELENMTEEELQEMIEKNEKTIEHNNKTLKKSLVERILDQQKIISEQQQEIMKLNSQKKEL